MKKRFLILSLALLLLFAGCSVREKTLYETALSRMDSCEYDKALVLFGEIPGYRDADERGDACREALNEKAYRDAEALMDAGDYASAREAFTRLGGYSDAAKRADEAAGRLGEEAIAPAIAEMKTFATAEDWDEDLSSLVLGLDDYADYEPNGRVQHLADALRYLAAADTEASVDAIKKTVADGTLTASEWEALLTSLLRTSLTDEARALKLFAVLNAVSPAAPALEAENPEETGDADINALRVPDFTLFERAGKAAANKALIYVTRHHYASEDQAYLDLDRMRLLAPELAAVSPEEASYVILVHYDYKHVQKFTTYYNWGVREYAVVQVIETPSGKEIGAAAVLEGPAAKSLKTAKITSEFVSGGPVDEAAVAKAVQSAVERVTALLGKN